MKNTKRKQWYHLISILILLTVCFAACKKDDSMNSNYEGNWTTLKPVPTTTGYVDIEYDLKLTDDHFTETFLSYQGSAWPTYYKQISIEGSFSVSGNIMSFTSEKISFSKYENTFPATTAPYAIYTRDEDDIDEMQSGFVFITAGHEVEYSLIENKLSLKVDYNENGDFSDDYQPFTYTRQ